MKRKRRRFLLGLTSLPWVLSVGCDAPQDSAKGLVPVPIADGDECHLCGMIINNFPGPKGEAYVLGGSEPLKFCSTRDLFAFLTQPEARANVRAAFVHDIAATPWDRPAFEAFVAASGAWYVAEQPLRGAMGPTLASFAERAAAKRFIEEYGGRLLAYDDVTVDLISRLD